MPETPQETRVTETVSENKALDLSSFRDSNDDLFEDGGRRKRTRRFWIAGISLVLLIAIGAGLFTFIQKSQVPPVSYQSTRPLRSNFSLSVNATGPIQANTEKADFSVAGKITRLDVKLYDHVTRGQSLAQLTRADKARVTLQAPVTGVVTGISNNVGDSIAGAVAGGFIQITDLSALQIEAAVNEADIGQVAVGDAVQFTVSSYSGQSFGGSVTAVSPLGQTQSSVVTFPVIVSVDMSSVKSTALLPNMTASVTITTVSRPNALLISTRAVSFAKTAPIQGIVPISAVAGAMMQAQQLLSTYKASDKTAAEDQLSASYVLEHTNNRWIIKPIVLSLTDGTFFLVVAGDITTSDSLITAIQNGSNASDNPQLPSGSNIPGMSGSGGLGN